MTERKVANRLIKEKSPYLLQHAHNPVDWYPWGDEAFEKAKSQDKPIFLSIGYSTCHWCHVMERESFEDVEVANALNGRFISIKVDREERPDIDHVYMEVCQNMTGSGGWPLNVIMTPDKEPFFAGTYFPKKTKYGHMGLIELLDKVDDLWANSRNDLIDSARQVINNMSDRAEDATKTALNESIIHEAYHNLKASFDEVYGGFRDAPKFPSPHTLMFLLRYSKIYGEKQAVEMAIKTADSMYRGGLYDHIGFGFSRYSTDKKWLVPHFEKMIYDNALLIYAYTEMYQITKDDFYKSIAMDACSYILRDMTSDKGGFLSAEDADSEGVEGKFYVWDKKEIIDILGKEDGEYFCENFDISKKGNFEGSSIPNLIDNKDFRNVKDDEKIRNMIEKLYAQRNKRVKPFKDDKILTSWNGLTIAALAYAGRTFGEKGLTNAAFSAADFILKNMIREDGRLMARYRDGEVRHLAYLEDYSYFIWGLIELYMSTFENKHLETAYELTEDMIRLFHDEKSGGFYHYGSDGEELIIRPKELYDGALPSGNSVAAMVLQKLSLLTDKPEYEEIAGKMFVGFGTQIEGYPEGFTYLLSSFLYFIKENTKISLIGGMQDSEIQNMIEAINNMYLPDAVVTLKERDEIKEATDGNAIAYVCSNKSCSLPITNHVKLRDFFETHKNR